MNSISIIICVNDAEDTICQTFESLMNQTVKNKLFNLIVINDGSRDSSGAIIQRYSNEFSNFTFIDRKSNKGVVFSMNEGIKQVTTDWFMRLDPDDTLKKDAIEQFLKVVNDHYDLILSNRVHVKCDKKEIIKVSSNIFSWIGCGVLIKTKNAKKISLYSSVFWEEFDFYTRYFQEGFKRYHIIDLPLYEYLIRENSITSSSESRKKGFEELIRIYGKETLRKYGYEGKDYFK